MVLQLYVAPDPNRAKLAELGWGVTEQTVGAAWSHSGTTHGFYSSVTVLPDDGLGIAVLTSRNAGPFKAAPTALLDGVLQIVQGQKPEPYFPWERLVRVLLACSVLAGIYGTVRLQRTWRSLKSPRRMAHTAGVVGRVVFDLALPGVFPLWIIQGVLKLPIQEILVRYPDIGVALILFPAVAIPAAVLRSLVTSEKLRQAS